jgi:hypothetical protein
MRATCLIQQMGRGRSDRTLAIACVALLAVLAACAVRVSAQTKPTGAEPVPQPAIPAILAAFDKYEVVGMTEAHGEKDEDDFILSLIRNPEFPEKVNDIAVECGNSLYQPLLDRYIAGEDVPFTDAQKVWRDTTQPMCSFSGFFEEFFPLVRAINQKLPPDKRLRVLAGDPPIDWNNVKGLADAEKDRDGNIASVMEKEVLSKHRKALMLFGESHLFHGGGVGQIGFENAVAIYEKEYPGRTFIIGSLELFDLKANGSAAKPFEKWPYPSLTQVTGTWLGAVDITHFYLPVLVPDKDCNVLVVYPASEQKPISELVDALLYLGPGDLSLAEPMPADILVDAPFMAEMFRRETLMGLPVPKTIQEFERQIAGNASQPLLEHVSLAEMQSYFPFVRQACLAHQRQDKPGR